MQTYEKFTACKKEAFKMWKNGKKKNNLQPHYPDLNNNLQINEKIIKFFELYLSAYTVIFIS